MVLGHAWGGATHGDHAAVIQQQVNLYHPIFRRQHKRFSAKAMLQAGLGVLLGTALLYGYSGWQLLSLKGQVAAAAHEQEQARARRAALTTQAQERPADPRLQHAVRDLETQLAAADQVRALLTNHGLQPTIGYSRYFTALARQHVDGVWLTEFSVKGAGERLTLNGRTVDPELVPRYLQRLSQEQALAGAKFQVFQMRRPADDKDQKASAAPYIEFTVKTSEEAEVKNHEPGRLP